MRVSVPPFPCAADNNVLCKLAMNRIYNFIVVF